MDEAIGLATARYFLGRWQMVRLIDDRVGGGFGEFWGEAVFAPPDADDREARGDVPTGSGTAPGTILAPALDALRTEHETPDAWGEFSGLALGTPPDMAQTVGGAGAAVLLVCRENGVLRLGGRDYAAGRVTLWQFVPNGAVRIAHDDGRAFHDFDPVDPRALHFCGDDRYEVEYDFCADTWLSRWRVIGPRKDYRMTTRYTRILPGGSPGV